MISKNYSLYIAAVSVHCGERCPNVVALYQLYYPGYAWRLIMYIFGPGPPASACACVPDIMKMKTRAACSRAKIFRSMSSRGPQFWHHYWLKWKYRGQVCMETTCFKCQFNRHPLEMSRSHLHMKIWLYAVKLLLFIYWKEIYWLSTMVHSPILTIDN